jgi:hypothetical protein
MERKDETVRQQLYDLRLKGRERYLELMGVDMPKVRALEKELDTGYEKLAGEVRRSLKKAGAEAAEWHRKSQAKGKRMLEAEVAKAAILEHLEPKVAIPLCWCFSIMQATPVGTGEDDVVIDPPTGGTGSGSVTYDATGNVAHPIADAKGGGTGTINSAQVTTWFKFAFTPSHDRAYCIRPLAYMNGHWLLWTWGTCGGTPEDLGSGIVRATVKVRVTQLASTIKEIEHDVVNVSLSAGSSQESGFYYDSSTDGGASTFAVLEGGHEAVIFVSCDIYAKIANHGRAWVDMQTSPHFYFKVPELYWGPVVCDRIYPSKFLAP